MNAKAAAELYLESIDTRRLVENDIDRLANLINEFAKAGFRKGLEAAKEIYQGMGLDNGACEFYRIGEKCACYVCRVENAAEAIK